jgi:hypothetical protein
LPFALITNPSNIGNSAENQVTASMLPTNP